MRIKGLTGQQIQQYLTEALLILMETKDYGSISIGEIADKAGVNRSSYYRHFSGKEDILRFYLMTIMNEYQEAYRKGSDRTFMLICSRFSVPFMVTDMICSSCTRMACLISCWMC